MPRISAPAQSPHHRLPCAVVAAFVAAAVFAFVAGQPMTARPSRVLAELLADAGTAGSSATGHGTAGVDRAHVDTADLVWTGATELRLARARRTVAPSARLRTGAAGRRRSSCAPPQSAPGTTGTPAVAGPRPGRRWLRRLGICTGLLAGLLAGLLLAPAAAYAEPTPAPPSPTAPTQPPTPSPTTAECGGGDLPAGQQRWCFGWAVYTPKRANDAVSHWTTACSRTKTPDELAACRTVSLEYTSKPKDGARATLADVAAGTAPTKDMVGCKHFTDAARRATARGDQAGVFEAQVWTSMASRCNAIAEALLPALGATTAPPPPKVEQQCDVLDQQCKIEKAVGDAVGRGIDAGIQGVINLVVQGVAVVLSWLASQVFTQTSIGAPDDAFYLVYNSTAGVMLIFVFVLFIVSAIINTLRVNGGPGPLASVGGLVRAVIGIFSAGGLAWLIVTAWDQATNALLAQNDGKTWDASLWITTLTKLSGGAGTGAVALVGGGFSLVGLVFVGIIMVFRGMLTTAAALFGAIAMAGQASHETRVWGRRWFWTVNALASSKFAIVALWIYATRATYGSDDIVTVLFAVLIIWLMVFAPAILLRLTAIWDGYLADANGRGFATAAAAGIGELAGRATDSLMDRFGGGQPSGGGDAAEVMDDNVTDMDNADTGGGNDETTNGTDANAAADAGDSGETTDTGDAGDTEDGAGGDVAGTAGELTADAQKNESGEPVGAVDDTGGPAAGDGEDGGTAHRDEAEAIGDNADGARADVAAATDDLSGGGQSRDGDGGVQVPADPTGESGNGQSDGQSAGSDDVGGGMDPDQVSAGTGPPDVSASAGGTSSDPSAGSDNATEPPDGGPAGGADNSGPGDSSDGGGGAEPPAGGGPAGGADAAGAGGAGSGGSSAAAAAAV
ncbi:hypothetical protein [Dactylosporangium sp. CA-152071]|uniref:hypothetical protein n=1 Tax=Dactylosporangium sp. CA-152071 TaxID=3239933 RepID=UPI003D8D844E